MLLISSLIVASVSTWIDSQIDSALPTVDAKETVFELTNSATLARNEQGIVTIKASNRLDMAVTTDFGLAQTRFYK